MSMSQGLTGEYLVAADLCRQGYTAFLSASYQRYDLVVDVGTRLLRVQVKSTATVMLNVGSRMPTYRFRLWNTAEKTINPSEVDVVALVAVDSGHIAYLLPEDCAGRSLKLKPAGTPVHGRSKKNYNIDQLPFAEVLKELV